MGENIRNYRLNRFSFKNYLAKRYKSKIAETIVSCFDFSMPWDHTNYFEGLEVFVNHSEESLRKLLFNALDFNGDNYISEIDLFALMRTLDSDIFVEIASKDVIDLVNYLHKKKKDKGLHDPITNKMNKLKDKQHKNYKNYINNSLAQETIFTTETLPTPSKNDVSFNALKRIADVIENEDPTLSYKNSKNKSTMLDEIRTKSKFLLLHNDLILTYFI